jgi:Dual-action HEIGH metallo-peptidase.
MKKRFLTLASLALIFAGLNSCSKTDPVTNAVQQGLSAEIQAKITALGFDAHEAYPVEGGYIVENDIFLSEEDLSKPIDLAHSLVIADHEQYHTTNLVTGLPRTIVVKLTGNYNANISDAVDNSLTRYNNQSLGLTFQRNDGSSSPDITIKIVNGGSFIASAGFPSGGNPYHTVQFNRQYRSWSNATLTTVFAHEIGHCIGFRHTDYMNRSYSCGSGGNEGDGGVGAIHIPGTPTGPDAASWMLACIGNGVNRPFNANDVTALNHLYD